MKTKTTTPLLSRAARLLLITCTTLASPLSLLVTAAAQSNDVEIVNDNLTISTGSTIQFGTKDHTIYYKIPTDTDFTISEEPTILTINNSFACNTLSFESNIKLAVDGTLTVKGITCDSRDATMILCPNSIVDLGGSTLIASAFTLADGTNINNGTYQIKHDGKIFYPAGGTYFNPFFLLSNGAKLIHGTLVVDSAQSNALHLVESNEHSSNQVPGAAILIPESPCTVTGSTFSNATFTQ